MNYYYQEFFIENENTSSDDFFDDFEDEELNDKIYLAVSLVEKLRNTFHGCDLLTSTHAVTNMVNIL